MAPALKCNGWLPAGVVCNYCTVLDTAVNTTYSLEYVREPHQAAFVPSLDFLKVRQYALSRGVCGWRGVRWRTLRTHKEESKHQASLLGEG
jgi:hypothetical protein